MKLDGVELSAEPVGTRCHGDDPAPTQGCKPPGRESLVATTQVQYQHVRIAVEGVVQAGRDVDPGCRSLAEQHRKTIGPARKLRVR